jgi:hypothetical protein
VISEYLNLGYREVWWLWEPRMGRRDPANQTCSEGEHAVSLAWKVYLWGGAYGPFLDQLIASILNY